MIDALLLIQDVQLLCFAVIFGFVALQHRADRTRRWLWYSFLANAAGAFLDFLAPHSPAWLSRAIDLEMVPLSYVLVNAAFAVFLRRFHRTVWISAGLCIAALPMFLLWRNDASHVRGDTVQDVLVGLQCLVIAAILTAPADRASRLPRWLMSAFFFAFAEIELTRGIVFFSLHHPPDFYRSLELTSSVAYVVCTSVLPLAFLWLINTRLESELVLQNQHDPLTQVLNRRGLRPALERAMFEHEETGSLLTIAVLDLDYFKRLNDEHGHAAGDAMLQSTARLIQRCVREDDAIARLGGEEFAIVLPRMSEEAAQNMLERLRIQIENHSETFEGRRLCITASIGFTTTRPDEMVNATDLLRRADLAVYRAKADGRNRVQAFCGDDVSTTRPALHQSHQPIAT